MNRPRTLKSIIILVGFGLSFPLSAATLTHRWSFDEADPLADSVGGNNGVLQNGATTGGGNLVLAGLGTSTGGNHMAFSSPIDIGGNFGATGVTIESWYTDSGTGTWGKLFQFGQNSAGQELAYTHTRGNGQQSGIDRDGAQLFGTQIAQNEAHHLVITVSSDGNLNTWVDGTQLLTNVDTNDLSNVNTNFEAIGATSWGDPGMNGTVDEFRIYEGELTAIEVAASTEAGPDQIFVVEDSDRDGLPDSWEERWFGAGDLSQGADDDPDSDNLSNLEEFEFNPNLNPNEGDTDDDGLNDGREVNVENTDPLDPDSDDDTLSDGDEVLNFQTNPLDADSDGDFYSDAIEIANETDPNDSDSPGPVSPALIHRWSFTEGSELIDSVGGNTGTLRASATVSDNQLQLDGAGTGPGASSMGFTTPVDIGGNFGGSGFSIETWYTDLGTPNWGKLFTFGTNAAGQEIAWTHQRANTDLAPGLDRNGAIPIDSIPFGSNDRLPLDNEHHLVITVEADGTTNLWIDGTREITNAPTNPVNNIVTDTESIGSTAWNDPGHFGTVNEFRIWKGTLAEENVTANFVSGPDALPGETDLLITDISRDAGRGSITLTFTSVVGRRYRIDRADELAPVGSPLWIDVDDEFIATSDLSTYTDPTATGDRLFYRIVDITNQ